MMYLQYLIIAFWCKYLKLEIRLLW